MDKGEIDTVLTEVLSSLSLHSEMKVVQTLCHCSLGSETKPIHKHRKRRNHLRFSLFFSVFLFLDSPIKIKSMSRSTILLRRLNHSRSLLSLSFLSSWRTGFS